VVAAGALIPNQVNDVDVDSLDGALDDLVTDDLERQIGHRSTL
jgi:hypothetical protein